MRYMNSTAIQTRFSQWHSTSITLYSPPMAPLHCISRISRISPRTRAIIRRRPGMCCETMRSENYSCLSRNRQIVGSLWLSVSEPRRGEYIKIRDYIYEYLYGCQARRTLSLASAPSPSKSLCIPSLYEHSTNYERPTQFERSAQAAIASPPPRSENRSCRFHLYPGWYYRCWQVLG